MQTISDHQLIQQLRAGDNASFKQLRKDFFKPISYYVTKNMGNYEDAKDIFQEAQIVLFQKVQQPDFKLSATLKTYLYSIAKNMWLKKLRDDKLIISEYNPAIESCYQQPETRVFEIEPERDKEEQIHEWLSQITENCQLVLKSIYFYNEPMTHLMAKMGWKNKGTATTQKNKCKMQLKKKATKLKLL
ncbi:MAG: sigma-70 family RNA polymerase sigma factor [Bacteroidetes bacterium]|nr:sigma-70 family RNA polymerase sigma factor [Bacteroidota bacterium]